MKRFCILVLLCGGVLYGEAFAQGNWLRNLGILGDDTQPKYEKIEFWDPSIQDNRTIRALFYTVLPDKENVVLDRRLHTQMTQYLNVICGSVMTMETFQALVQQLTDRDEIVAQLNEWDMLEAAQREQMDPVRFYKQLPAYIEKEIVRMLDEWELRGRVDPARFFEALPFLDVDIVIFMERSQYDPAWRGVKKYLNIGVDLAAVEMDLGEPIFSERFTKQVPWTEENISYVKAEQEVLLDASNAMGEQFQQVSNMINQLREQEEQQQMVADEMAARETRERLRNEFRAYQALAAEGIRMLNQRTEPANQLQTLVAKLEAFVPLVQRPDLPEEQIEMRRLLAQDVAFTMQSILDWLPPEQQMTTVGPPDPREQLSDALANDATSVVPPASDLQAVDLLEATPSPTPALFSSDPLLPLPQVPNLLQGIFDRSWLLPDNAQSTPALPTPAQPTPGPTATPAP